jgi:hypothetical protein
MPRQEHANTAAEWFRPVGYADATEERDLQAGRTL